MDDKMKKTLNERYPFLSLIIYAGIEYVGIIQNRDDSVTTIYDFGALDDKESKRTFLELANAWWWGSNRSIPINLFLKKDWHCFRACSKTFSNKDLEIVHGPVCSLQELTRKKSKRRSITLVRKI